MIGSQSHTPRYSNDEKHLIAEQPGRAVIFLGVLLALTLGLIVRGLISPNKVKSHVASAASRIHKDLKVEFETASVSLSRGLLPRFAVVIGNVRMESQNPCWMTPLLTADEIRLPLSFWALLRGENPVTQVGAGKVRVHLRTDLKDCHESTSAPTTPGPAPAAVADVPKAPQFVTLKDKKIKTIASTPQPQVQAISIDELTVISPTLAAPLELSTFVVRLKSNSPKVIEMTAKTHLIKDDQFGDYLSHASVWAEYTEFPKTHLLGRITGNWREGSYQVKASYFLKEEELSSELDLKHVPLSQVSQVLKKFNLLKSEMSARQVWVSVNAQMNGSPSNLKTAQMHLKDLRLDGDLGDIRVPSATITSFEPLSYAPFQVEMKGLDIEKLLSLSGRPHPSPVFGELGNFTGHAEIKSPEQIEVSGVHKGLEFIFSNKGQRELQTVKEIRSEAKLLNNRWMLSAFNAEVDQGSLLGSFVINADRSWKNLDIESKIDELRFSPNVIRLMTANGAVGALQADVRAKIRDGKLSGLKGVITSEGLTVEGVSVSKSRWQLDTFKEDIVADGQIPQASILAGSPSFQVLKPVIEPDWMSDGRLEIRNLTTQLQFKDLKNFAWKNLSAQLLKNVRLVSEGDWDQEGSLSGQVQWNNGKTSRRWALSGRRDEPVFALSDTSKKKKQ
jgi:hypothetical protein